jgi:hypothetical protein
MKLFISHISEESNLALVLKEWIESSFAGQCEVFVSSDKDDIPAGAKWLDEIDKALENAIAFVVLCSPASLARPWINFETGCGWIKRVPIVPVCHSGQSKSALPPPISMFQAIEVEDEKFISDLLTGLAKHFGISKIPRIDQDSMRQELIAAASNVKLQGSTTREKRSTEIVEELPSEALEILKVLCQISGRDPTAYDLAQHFKISEQRMQYFLEFLDEKSLIYRALYMGSPSTYSLTSDGRKYLFDRGLL